MFDHDHGVVGFDKPIEHVDRDLPVAVPGSQESGLVPGCGRGADARLRPYLLGQKAATVLCRLAASVEDREQPDAHESDRYREQRRRGVREQRTAFRIAQGRFPHRRRHDCEQHR